MAASTIDVGDIAAGIATAFGNLTTPSGLTPIQVSTHLLPENLVSFPCVLVFPYREPEAVNNAGSRMVNLFWPVRLFIDMTAETPVRTAQLYEWAQSMASVFPVGANINLGLSYVQTCEIVQFPFMQPFEYPTGTTWPAVVTMVKTHCSEALP